VIVRAARPEEAGAISALALRSKAHWGYEAAFLEACRADLTIDPAWCDGVRLVVADGGGLLEDDSGLLGDDSGLLGDDSGLLGDDSGLLGYARVAGDPPAGELAGLFVDPVAIGRGVGGLLLRHAVGIAARLGFRTLEIDSDPYAEAFYLHAGAARVGEFASTVDPARLLPRLRLAVTPPP
jgi:GNAT superfamily N-acetyltransferase